MLLPHLKHLLRCSVLLVLCCRRVKWVKKQRLCQQPHQQHPPPLQQAVCGRCTTRQKGGLTTTIAARGSRSGRCHQGGQHGDHFLHLQVTLSGRRCTRGSAVQRDRLGRVEATRVPAAAVRTIWWHVLHTVGSATGLVTVSALPSGFIPCELGTNQAVAHSSGRSCATYGGVAAQQVQWCMGRMLKWPMGCMLSMGLRFTEQGDFPQEQCRSAQRGAPCCIQQSCHMAKDL